MTEGVKTLVSSFDYVAEKATVSTEMLQSKVSDFSGAGEQIRTSVEDIFEALLPKIQELKASSALIKNINDENNAKMLRANELMIDFHDRVSKNIDQITESVGAQTERLESVAEKLWKVPAACGIQLNGISAILRKPSKITKNSPKTL